jgi:hypothetical protein
MIARDLNEIDRHIAATRERIERQRETVRKLHKDGHAGAAAQAEQFLRTLEGSLTILQERRGTILRQLRRPRATPKRRSSGTASRRSSGG